jgi:hypothetical protein
MNKNIWNLYKSSERGQKAIALFTIEEDDDFEEKMRAIFQKYNEYFGGLEVEDYVLDNYYGVFNNLIIDNLLMQDSEEVSDYFNRLIDNIEMNFVEETNDGQLFKPKNRKPFIEQKDYKTFCSIMSEISLVLYTLSPDAFFPILFREQFDVLMKIFDVLEISLPQLPTKTDKRGRLLFYNDLCNEIFNFKKENGLTTEETCACIYDFALMLIEDDKDTENLPEPTNIWLTGGSKEDYETFLKEPVAGNKSVWTCNENTKRGDIIIMYVRTPYSCIQSIWRADIDGVFTPFGYYNSRVRVTNGIVVPPITLNELKADSYFSQLPITRKNFQGVNGVPFSAKDYSELQRLLNEKGFDVSVLPQLYNPDLEKFTELKNEKDVEEKLLIPVLKKLGYAETDWIRQLSQKAGRKEKAIPDFVFFPKGEIHFQNAPMLIEAKFDMSSNIERTKAYNQALSYARMMKSAIFGICDKDRIIIYKSKKDYFDRFKPTFEKHWQSLNDVENFLQLKKLIGKDIIKAK